MTHQDLGRADQTSAWFQVALDAVVSSAPGLRNVDRWHREIPQKSHTNPCGQTNSLRLYVSK